MKLKENVISSLARDSVIKFDATTVHSVGIRLLYAEEEKTKPITNSKRIVFDLKIVFMLYSETFTRLSLALNMSRKLLLDP